MTDHRDHHRDDRDDREVRKLAARMNELERDVAAMARDATVADATAGREDSGPVNRDARWHCKKCGYLLGFYDLQEDLLRTRYKEHIVFVRCGEGGFVQVVCRGCSEVNTAQGEGVHDDSQPAASDEAG